MFYFKIYTEQIDLQPLKYLSIRIMQWYMIKDDSSSSPF